VAAHPDDEILGAGGQVPDWPGVVILHLTAGAPRGSPERDAYVAARRAELHTALTLAGVPPERRVSWSIVDQETAHHLLEMSWALRDLLSTLQPHLLLTHPYEGGHPDHDSAAFIARTAHLLPEQQRPLRVEFTSYHNAAPFKDERLETGTFLPGPGDECCMELTVERRSLKRRFLDCFASQADMIAKFDITRERFRTQPEYDFGLPPHPGLLFYDSQDWGVKSVEWRRLAIDAQRRLRLAS
jgi:LmbE family N-acetylglucosaminyl deacetylase